MVSALSSVGFGGLVVVGAGAGAHLVGAALSGNMREFEPYFGRGMVLVGGLAGLALIGSVRMARPGEILAIQGRYSLQFVRIALDVPFVQSVERISVRPCPVAIVTSGVSCKFCATPRVLSQYYRMLPEFGRNKEQPLTETLVLESDVRGILRDSFLSGPAGKISNGRFSDDGFSDDELSDSEREKPPARSVMSATTRAEIATEAHNKIMQAGTRLGFRITDLELEISPRAFGILAARTSP